MPGPYVGNPFAGRFGTFQTAVNTSLRELGVPSVQSYVWNDIRQYYAERGEPLPPGAFQAVNQLLSLAGQQKRAQVNLAAGLSRQEQGPFNVGITQEMTAPHLDTRALNEMPLGPQHRVVYITQDLVEGEPVLTYKTHDYGYNLPQSIAQLNADVEDAAQITAADYGFEWGGVATPVGIYSY